MRTFFCIELSDEVTSKLAKIIASFRNNTEAKVNWVDKENLHITMKFLGNIDPGKTETIKEKSKKAADSVSPFKMTLDKIGVFPNLRRLRVIWVGSREEPGEVHKLNRNLEGELKKIGFDPEGRKYIPHITLGRVKERDQSKVKPLADQVESYRIEETIPAEADGLTLMESKLTPEGPIYTPVFKHSFE